MRKWTRRKIQASFNLDLLNFYIAIYGQKIAIQRKERKKNYLSRSKNIQHIQINGFFFCFGILATPSHITYTQMLIHATHKMFITFIFLFLFCAGWEMKWPAAPYFLSNTTYIPLNIYLYLLWMLSLKLLNVQEWKKYMLSDPFSYLCVHI